MGLPKEIISAPHTWNSKQASSVQPAPALSLTGTVFATGGLPYKNEVNNKEINL